MTTAFLLCAAMLAADNPAPNNVFIALEAPLSEEAKKRLEAMKAQVKTFRLELNYNGHGDKPFYRLIVSVPEVGFDRGNPFNRTVQVKNDQATEIIDHLARDGFLDKAVDLRTDVKLPPPSLPGYTLKVVTGDLPRYEDFGWGLPMIQRLDALRDVLPDSGQKEMDLLLGRLTGLRALWEAEQPALTAQVGREGSRVQFLTEDDTTIIDIASEFGIDKATISRKSGEWPKALFVRLHLGGLESFKAGRGDVEVEWSVSSTGDHATRTSLVSGKEAATITQDSLYFTAARIVGGDGRIPLQDGYFEVPLPAKLFEENPEEITLRWIDFYRN